MCSQTKLLNPSKYFNCKYFHSKSFHGFFEVGFIWRSLFGIQSTKRLAESLIGIFTYNEALKYTCTLVLLWVIYLCTLSIAIVMSLQKDASGSPQSTLIVLFPECFPSHCMQSALVSSVALNTYEVLIRFSRLFQIPDLGI